MDFDESSRAWLQNKIRKGYSYVYKCDRCEKPAVSVKGDSLVMLCLKHRREETRKTK